jgi:hypothetical protein
MKIKIVEQVGSAYWLEGNDLIVAPFSNDNVFYIEDGGIVDYELFGSEPLPEPYGKAKTFGELYDIIRKELTLCTHNKPLCGDQIKNE